jgi:hypothetical protein
MRAALAALLFASLAAAAQAQPADAVHTAAQSHGDFQADLVVLAAADITDQAALDLTLQRLSRDHAELARGAIAYAALAAAEAPAFQRGVQARVRAAGRVAVLRQLRRDPGYARRRPPGAAEAVQYALAAIAADRARFQAAARGYDRLLFADDWPILDPAARTARDASLRAFARPAHTGAATAFSFGPPRTPLRFRPARTQTIDRIVTLAAFSIAGAGDDPASQNLDDAPTRECLALAQLQFRQCVSVSRGGAEDAACLAEHGLRETSACLSAVLSD